MNEPSGITMDIILIPGALATPQFWHNQEQHFQNQLRVYHPAVLSGQSVQEIAESVAKTLPKPCSGQLKLDTFKFLFS